MRILTVSAHYPPNFVSGGTPAAPAHRQGLRARGHESASTPAGWATGRRSSPGRHRRDRDGRALGRRPRRGSAGPTSATGTTLRSPSTSGPMSPSSGPTSCTCTRCSRSAPGCCRRPAPPGARVVVTMHDFWWLCARQFLVDSRPAPVLPRGRGRRLRLPGRRGLAAPTRGAALATLLGVGRPGAGPVGHGRRGCSPPTAWPRAASRSTRTACPTRSGRPRRPRRVPVAARPHRTGPVRFALHRRARTSMKGVDVLARRARLGSTGTHAAGAAR